MLCEYYQAIVDVPYTWFVGGVFRNEDNLVFERTVDGRTDLLEFFVTKDQEQEFLDLINYLVTVGFVLSFEKQTNRMGFKHSEDRSNDKKQQ
jgi:hypothetical protein